MHRWVKAGNTWVVSSFALWFSEVTLQYQIEDKYVIPTFSSRIIWWLNECSTKFSKLSSLKACWVSHNAPLCSPISSFLTNHNCSLFNLGSTKSIPIRSNRFLVFQILPFSSFLTNHNRSLLNLWSTRSIPTRSNSFLVFQIPPISWFLTNHIYSLFNLGSTESIPSRSNSFFSSSDPSYFFILDQPQL